MAAQIQLGEIAVDVIRKDIKNVHLSVYPPAGRVRISAPSHMHLDTIRVFAISKLGWIKKEQKKIREQERETPREFLERESHYVWGKRYLLEVEEGDQPPLVAVENRRLVLHVRPGTDPPKREAIVEQWYREQVKAAIPPLIAKWEPKMGVRVDRFFVQRMKIKWGRCSPTRRTIRLNTELAKKPPECLEYLVVHEMVHLLEPTHNQRFVALMDRLMPHWRTLRDLLNKLPVRHERWRF